MRRIIPVIAAVALLFGLMQAPASTQGLDTFASSNVDILGQLPNPGVIGARFRGDVMYVTASSGLTTYDISQPGAPVELGRLPLPHFENEDVDLGGNILLISNDAAESRGILYIIDISDPAAPELLSFLDMGGNPVEGGAGHTASCVLRCKFAWVTDGGGIRVIDLRDPAQPKSVGTYALPQEGLINITHDVQKDRSGLYWVASYGGTFAYRLPDGYDPAKHKLGNLVTRTDGRGLSTYEQHFGTNDGTNWNDYIHHNSERSASGSVLYITEEDYNRPTCRGAGSFQTWAVPLNRSGDPNGKPLFPLDSWAPEHLSDGTVATAMCSAHYFDVKDNLVAQGWYEAGLRFLDVSDPRNIRQIGYYIPPNAMTWAAYFTPTDPTGRIVYVLDASHGIDVLKISRPARGPLSSPRRPCRSTRDCRQQRPRTATAPTRPEWYTTQPRGIADPRFGYACRIPTSVL